MEIEIKGYRCGLLGKWVEMVEDEFAKIINEDERISDFYVKNNSDKTPITISTQLRTMAQRIQSNIFDGHTGKVSRKYVNDKIREAHYAEKETIFTMRTHYWTENDKVYVKGCTLLIHLAPLSRDLCSFIYDLDTLWEMHKWLLHHEVGHFIDHILNGHNISLQESDREYDRVQKDYANHYEWVRKYEKEPGYNCDTVNRAYYNIPSEARANEYGGVDIDEMIRLSNKLDSYGENSVITLDISVRKVVTKSESKGE